MAQGKQNFLLRKGGIAEGKRADLVLVDPAAVPRPVATVAGGALWGAWQERTAH